MTVVKKTGEEAEEVEEEDLAGREALRVIAAVNLDTWRGTTTCETASVTTVEEHVTWKLHATTSETGCRQEMSVDDKATTTSKGAAAGNRQNKEQKHNNSKKKKRASTRDTC